MPVCSHADKTKFATGKIYLLFNGTYARLGETSQQDPVGQHKVQTRQASTKHKFDGRSHITHSSKTGLYGIMENRKA